MIVGASSKINFLYDSGAWCWPVFEGILIETVYLSVGGSVPDNNESRS